MSNEVVGSVVVNRYELLKLIDQYVEWHAKRARLIQRQYEIFLLLKGIPHTTRGMWKYLWLKKRPYLIEDAESDVTMDGGSEEFHNLWFRHNLGQASIPDFGGVINEVRALCSQQSEMVTIYGSTARYLEKMREYLAEDTPESPLDDQWRTAALVIDRRRRGKWGLL